MLRRPNNSHLPCIIWRLLSDFCLLCWTFHSQHMSFKNCIHLVAFGCKEQRSQLRKEICLVWGYVQGQVGSDQGTSRLPSYLSEFPLVLSFSFRLVASSENIMVSRGRKEATYLLFLFRGPLLGFSSCLIGQDWVTCPFPIHPWMDPLVRGMKLIMAGSDQSVVLKQMLRSQTQQTLSISGQSMSFLCV